MFNSYKELLKSTGENTVRKLAVVSAHDEEVLLSLQSAAESCQVHPVLIGSGKRIEELIKKLGLDFDFDVLDFPDDQAAAEAAADLAGRGEVSGLMKGIIATSIFLKAILRKGNGLVQNNLLSHVTVVESPRHSRLLFITDAAVNIAPDLKQKKLILDNAVYTTALLGNPEPKAAVLCAVEKETPSMQATMDAEYLRKMNESGEITDVTVSGPLSLDLAISPESVKRKGYSGPVAGDADILLVPEIETGNALVKSLFCFTDFQYGGVIMGAAVPIILTSRADTAGSKYNSILLASVLAEGAGGV